MHGKKKQHKAPAKWATKVAKPEQVEFNLAGMVYKYAVLKRLFGLFESAQDEQNRVMYPESRDFFDGKVHSYEEWFEAFEVDQDKFDEALGRINKQKIRSEADAIFIRIVEAKQNQDTQKVVLASEYSHKQIEKAKQIFDEALQK